MSFKKDYEYGLKKEDEIYDKLCSKFGKLIKISNYCKWDFEDENGRLFELKSRKNNYNKYPTTLIAKDKIIKGKKQYFIFNFLDKTTYIKYNEKKFNKFTCETFKRNFRYGFNDLEKLYYFIPIEELKEIN